MTVQQIIPSQLINAIDISNATSGQAMAAEAEKEAYGLFREAVESIKIIMTAYTCVVATSFGKDSTVVMLAAIQALRELIDEGKLPNDHPLVMTNIDTKVENHLVQILAYYEKDRLMSFAKKSGLNIDMRSGTPPLAKQWAALFLSGLKIISTARVNNDCSEIMKIDNSSLIERQVTKNYGEKCVTLLGSRIEESASRAQSIRKRGHDKTTADELIARDSDKDRVFAPIVNMTDEHVWTILRRAGEKPLVKSYAGLPAIPSYAPNHRLLHIIYSDSRDGSCPTSSKRMKSDSQKAGGCGSNPRTGCYMCAKSVLDKSGEAQARQARHRVISGNIIKVRNYVMSVAQDNRYRTFHSRAVDETTGAVALQPNVLNAKTIDKLIWLLSQATHDDYARAQRFKALVSAGREMDDEGYADIINDDMMSDEDKEEFAAVYKQYATMHLIQPMSAELALYLSLIHSRDGVRLPPYRAMHVWNATHDGQRIPYPDVSPLDAVIDDVPDAVMVVPSPEAVYLAPNPAEDTLSPETGDGCEWQSLPQTSGVPMRAAKYYLSPAERAKYDHLKDSDKVNIGWLFEDTLINKVRRNASSVQRKAEISGRSIVKRKKVDGESKIVQRSRTRVGSASFGKRITTSTFEKAHFSPVSIYTPSERMQHWVMDHFEAPVIGGYDVDLWQVAEWINIDGVERALAEHDKFVGYYESKGDSIYRYGGMGPFTTLLRYGLFRLTENSKRHAARIVKRTSYFNALGLLSLNDEELLALSQSGKRGAHHDVNEFRDGLSINAPMYIDALLPMPEYRQYKASYLLENVRAPRNASRLSAKQIYRDFWNDIPSGVCAQLNEIVTRYSNEYERYAQDYALAIALKGELKQFDGINIPRQILVAGGFLSYFESFFTHADNWFDLLDKAAVDHFKLNPLDKMQVMTHANNLYGQLLAKKAQVFASVKDDIQHNTGQRTLFFWLSHQHDAVKQVAISSLDELIGSAYDIQENATELASEVLTQTVSINDVSIQEGGMTW